jgi:hypothetical protein
LADHIALPVCEEAPFTTPVRELAGVAISTINESLQFICRQSRLFQGLGMGEIPNSVPPAGVVPATV